MQNKSLIAGFRALVVLLLLGFSGPVWAGQFEFQINNKIQTDEGKPTLVLRAGAQVKGARVILERSDGNKKTIRLGDLKRGDSKTITIEQPKGSFTYKATIEGKDVDDDEISVEISFDVTWEDPIKITIDRQKVDIGSGQLPFRSNRPVAKAQIEVFDESGKLIVDREQSFDGQRGDLVATWTSAGDVGGIRLTVHDTDGFWAGVLLEPFWVKIPHKEVVFETGKATWTKDQEPKLVETMAEIKKAMAEHAGKGLELQLYIAGYTDTVGSAESNQRLSAQRAAAIGRWFKDKGLKIPVYSQGFGESVLAVQTPDETDEARNRRAVYVLGNSPPATSTAFPRSNWQPVR